MTTIYLLGAALFVIFLLLLLMLAWALRLHGEVRRLHRVLRELVKEEEEEEADFKKHAPGEKNGSW